MLAGNTDSLQVLPEKMGIDVYERLQQFRLDMYSAHYMTVAVQSRRKSCLNSYNPDLNPSSVGH